MALLPMCLYNLSGTKNNNKLQFRSHSFFFFFFLIAPYNIPEPMNTSAMSWDPYVVRWSPCSNSYWWIRNHLSFLHHQNIPSSKSLTPWPHLNPSQPQQAWSLYILGFPGGSDGKESACNVGDLGSITGFEKNWRRSWQPTPVFFPGESPQTEEPGRLQSMGSQ